ncbi:MAG: hypothetical protein FJ033_15775 [Chloroflexi bacterium]|nr:hypothetical protein [Chloroflexota bacterium]
MRQLGSPVCNINPRGRRVRLMGGRVSLAAAVGVGMSALVLGNPLLGIAAALLAAGGVLALYEARRGWCAARAVGIPTPL